MQKASLLSSDQRDPRAILSLPVVVRDLIITVICSLILTGLSLVPYNCTYRARILEYDRDNF